LDAGMLPLCDNIFCLEQRWARAGRKRY
jgi:hypothetical protein